MGDHSITADGNTVFVCGHFDTNSGQSEGKFWVWNFDEASASWTESATYGRAETSFGHRGCMSPNGLFIAINQNNNYSRIWKGEDLGFKGTAAYNSDNRMKVFHDVRTSITSVGFSRGNIVLNGEVKADENNATTYYALATTKPLATDTERREVANGLGHASALLTATRKNKTFELKKAEITHVVDNSDANDIKMERLGQPGERVCTRPTAPPSTRTWTLNRLSPRCRLRPCTGRRSRRAALHGERRSERASDEHERAVLDRSFQDHDRDTFGGQFQKTVRNHLELRSNYTIAFIEAPTARGDSRR